MTKTIEIKNEKTIQQVSELLTVKLEGSEKQVAWAKDILVNTLVDCVNNVFAAVPRGEIVEMEINDKFIENMNSVSSARQIIDNRSMYSQTAKSVSLLKKVFVAK